MVERLSIRNMVSAPASSSELTDGRGLVELARVGQGGAGEVYRARRGRDVVAIKIARHEAAIDALAHEAEVLALADARLLPRLIDLGWLVVDDDRARMSDASSTSARA